MLPLRDDNPRLAFPFVTCLIIIINIMVQLAQWGDASGAFLYKWGLIPWEIIHLSDAHQLPEAFQSGIFNWLTPLTSLFLHGGWLHLLGNMLYLYIFGDNVESIMGHGRFLLFYLCCGLLASVCHVVASPQSMYPMVGASGAISGILGAYIMRFPRARVHVLIFIKIVRIPAVIVLGLWITYQIWAGIRSEGVIGGGVAWFAHIGGFLVGMLSVFIFERKERVEQSRQMRHIWRD
ncbi:rhomboid family intramembrane serine protease [bacterium]|nr:rhomboid family intramembrane serine protease [bacterium]